MFPECAISSTPNREIVFTTFRVLEEKICTRDPVVTANRSCDADWRFEAGGGGMEMWVTGDECCDGSSRNSEVKEFQYFCSDVNIEGPFGSFKGWSSCTSAAILYRGAKLSFTMQLFWWIARYRFQLSSALRAWYVRRACSSPAFNSAPTSSLNHPMMVSCIAPDMPIKSGIHRRQSWCCLSHLDQPHRRIADRYTGFDR
jgi:hypothetical protein